MEISILAGKSSRFDKKLISHKCLSNKNKSLLEKLLKTQDQKVFIKYHNSGYKRKK